MFRTGRAQDASCTRWLRIALGVAVVAIIGTACGSSDSSADTTADLTTTSLGATTDTTVVETPDVEFIELGYLEGIYPGTFEITSQPDEECDRSDPDVVVCDFEMSFESEATHLGRAFDTQEGTYTTYLNESCEHPETGETGNRRLQLGEGSITTAWGDQLLFIATVDQCVAPSGIFTFPSYWEVTGGTGRFEDAFGTMSGSPAIGDYFLSSVGTLHVRADLWEGTVLPDQPE